MFASAGYFRSANCPFFVHGLCHRPYCHFRHAKPGHGIAGKGKPSKSCLKGHNPSDTSGKEKPKVRLNVPSDATGGLEKEPSETSDNKTVTNEQSTDKSTTSTSESVNNTKQSQNIPLPPEPPKSGAAVSSILESISKLEQAVEEVSASLLSRPKRISHSSESETGAPSRDSTEKSQQKDSQQKEKQSSTTASKSDKGSKSTTDQKGTSSPPEKEAIELSSKENTTQNKDIVKHEDTKNKHDDDDMPIFVECKVVKKEDPELIVLSSGDEESSPKKVFKQEKTSKKDELTNDKKTSKDDQLNKDTRASKEDKSKTKRPKDSVKSKLKHSDDKGIRTDNGHKSKGIEVIISDSDDNCKVKVKKENNAIEPENENQEIDSSHIEGVIAPVQIKEERNNSINATETSDGTINSCDQDVNLSVRVKKEKELVGKNSKDRESKEESKVNERVKVKKEKDKSSGKKKRPSSDVENVSVKVKKEDKTKPRKDKKKNLEVSDVEIKVEEQIVDNEESTTTNIVSKSKEKKIIDETLLTDIDFFTSSPSKTKHLGKQKKHGKLSGKETKKHTDLASAISQKEKELELLKMKAAKRKSEKQQGGKQAKIHKSEKKDRKETTTCNLFGFESSDDGHYSGFSDSNEQSGSINHRLKEIFDDYDPMPDVMDYELTLSPEKRTVKTAVSSSSSTTSSPSKTPTKRERSDSVELQGLVKKQRVAHEPKHLIPRLSNNANPIRRYPKTIVPSASHTKATSSDPSSNELYPQAKRRIAHTPNTNSKVLISRPSLPRPRIPLEYGAKVPHNFRQRYLDKLIDEQLRLCASEKQAFERAVEEEQQMYNRATRRHMYLNLCINAIKKLRGTPTPERRPDPTPSPPTSSTATSTVNTPFKQGKSGDGKLKNFENLTEDVFYDLLRTYLLTEEELVDNGFPRPSASPGKVVMKPRKAQTNNSSNPLRRTCHRCGKPYSVREDGTHVRQEECTYHMGRLLRRRVAGEILSSYTCCDGDAASLGCAVGKFHVCEGKNVTEGFMTTIVSPLGNNKKVFSLDCEMCYTTAGLELTRATVVDWKLDNVYDTFVKPDNPILDFNTRFSGVTEECLHGVTTSIREVQAVLLSMIHKDTILVGHSLESDLIALKLVHSSVVDTSVVFPHRLGPPYKRALRNLTAEHLKQIIQDNEAGHDSYEDSKACLELMLHKAKEDLKKRERNKR